MINAIIILIQSDNKEGIGCGCFLLAALSNIFLDDNENGPLYPWEILVKNDLVKNLKKVKNETPEILCSLMLNYQLITNVKYSPIGFFGIEFARKYIFHQNIDVKRKACQLYTAIVKRANNESLNYKILSTDEFYQEIIQLMNDKDYEVLYEVIKLIFLLFQLYQNITKEIPKSKVLGILQKTISIVDLSLKENNFFTEGIHRHLTAVLENFSIVAFKEVFETKIVHKLFKKYHQYEMKNTQGNFLILFSKTLERLNENEANEFLKEIFKNITNEPFNSILQNNSIIAYRQMDLLTPEGKEFFKDIPCEGFSKQTIVGFGVKNLQPESKVK